MDARSGVGASGLMQLMPATARWTAKKIGLPYSPSMITDRDTNLRLGNAYLKLVLDDVGGSQAMAAAAYNAGPGRPRKWREGPVLEPAIWAENIPFPETRDYVKKVLEQRGLLRDGARRQGHDRALAPRPAGRARPIRTRRRRQRAALSRGAGLGENRRSPNVPVSTPPRHASQLPDPRRHRLRRPQRRRKAGRTRRRRRRPDPHRHPACGPRQAAAAAADGRGGGRRRPRRGHAGADAARHRRGDQPRRHPARQRGRVRADPRPPAGAARRRLPDGRREARDPRQRPRRRHRRAEPLPALQGARRSGAEGGAGST